MALSKNKQQSKTFVSESSMKNIKEQRSEKKVGDIGSSLRQREDLARYAQQFLLPIDVETPIVCPSNYPSQVCSRHIHRVVDISSATHPNGFTVVMSPDLFNPGFISNPVAVTAPTVVGTNYNIDMEIYGAKSILSDGDVDVYDGISDYRITEHSADGTVLKGSAKVVPSLSVAPDKLGFRASPGHIAYTAQLKYGGPCTLVFYTDVAGAWVELTFKPCGKGVVGGGSFVLPAGTTWLAFGLRDTDGSSVVSLGMNGSTNQIEFGAYESIAPAFEKFTIDHGITHGRVVSMSVLATNTSPEIANGGNINAGRVPSTFDPVHHNIASQISVLPSNRRYQGPAAKGAFVSWMPAQFDEFEIDSLVSKAHQLAEADYLLVQVRDWSPPAGTTASFRVQFDWVIEFYTPNQLFEKVITPVMDPSFTHLYHALLSMDAATCNPGHLDLLKKLVAKSVSGLRSGIKFYGENQKVIDGALLLLSKALL